MRRPPRRPRLALIATIVSAAAAFATVTEDLGEPMRWVHVVGMFAAGLASGAAIVTAVIGWRESRRSAI